MSRIYLILAGIFVVAGLIASLFAPTQNMGAHEAFYAHLLLIAPPLFVGTVISALALIIARLDRLLETRAAPRAEHAAAPAPQEDEDADFNSLFAEKLRADTKTPESSKAEPELPLMRAEPAPEPNNTASIPRGRAPTIGEYQSTGGSQEQREQSPRLAREGTFAGRNYRMYEDGSLEIDTDQSTIRFDSLEEFRSFVSTAAKN